LESRQLCRTLGVRIGVFIEWIGVTLPTLIIGSKVGIVMWWRVKAMKGVSMLNGRGTIVALNRSMPCTPQVPQTAYTPPGLGVSTPSNLYASASTLLARSVTTSTSYLPVLLLGTARSLDQ